MCALYLFYASVAGEVMLELVKPGTLECLNQTRSVSLPQTPALGQVPPGPAAGAHPSGGVVLLPGEVHISWGLLRRIETPVLCSLWTLVGASPTWHVPHNNT